jgi:hypothetical protein
MALSLSQRQALKADIAANTATIGGVQIKDMPNNSDANFDIANWYNQTASPDYFVFRSDASKTEIMNNGFDWTRVDNATVGKARIWDWLPDVFNANKPNIIAAINEAWSGGTNDAHRLAIFTHCQRLATWVEKLLKASGNGTTTSNAGVGPAVLGAESPISGTDVEMARAS